MTKGRCPICQKPAVEAFRPFCSKRCADVDLQRWFRGAYAIPGGAERRGRNARRPCHPPTTSLGAAGQRQGPPL